LPAAQKELSDISIQLRVSDLFERAPLIGAGISWTQKNMDGRHSHDLAPRGVVEET
jgi:hypothetical protein